MYVIKSSFRLQRNLSEGFYSPLKPGSFGKLNHKDEDTDIRDVFLLNFLFHSFKLESILEQLYFSQPDVLKRGEQCGVFSQQTLEDGETVRTNCTSM